MSVTGLSEAEVHLIEVVERMGEKRPVRRIMNAELGGKKTSGPASDKMEGYDPKSLGEQMLECGASCTRGPGPEEMD